MGVNYNSRGRVAPEVVEYKSLGTDAAISVAIAPVHKFRILNITAHGASAVTEPLTLTLNASQGAAYDTVLYSDATWTNLFKKGEPSEVFEAGDSLTLGCTNSAIVKGVVVRIELL